MKRSTLVFGGVGVFAAASIAMLSGCPASALNDCDNGNCDLPDGSNVEGGNPDSGPGINDGSTTMEGGNPVDAPVGCDLGKDPSDSPLCVDEGVGVFVDGNSNAASPDGSRKAPYKTIGAAVTANGRPRIYVCAGTYSENVRLDAAHAISLYGGFDCSGWKYGTTGNKVTIAPPKGVAVTIDGVKNVVLEDLEIDGSADQATAGDSAIAVFAANATASLKRVSLIAGKATNGAHGSNGTDKPNYNTPNATDGKMAMASTPGGATPCACLDGKTTSTGAKGAAPAGFPDDGVANPAVGAANGGSTGSGTCGDGTVGANGLAKSAGAGSTSSGSASASGWVIVTDSTAGATGNPAQGGGGGGAKNGVMTAGGGGGCGGCGGTGGGAGGTGGSSFALLSFNASLSIDSSTLTSGGAGSGGAGGDGQDGQGGGALGVGAACNGGPGGIGAGGSGGGGGSAGYSAAVAYVGAAPITTTTTTAAGMKGTLGAGGQPGAGGGNGGTAGGGGGAGDSRAVLKLQ